MFAAEQTSSHDETTVLARIGAHVTQLARSTQHNPRQNGLLAALPAADYQRLSESLELVALPLGRAVYESGTQLDYAYFPTDCIVSLLAATSDGSSAQIAVTGSEGLVGIALFMGGETTSSRAVVQTAGYAYRVPSAVLRHEFSRGGALQLLLLRFARELVTQMAQTAACSRHHSLEQQFCRWLLLSIDRLPASRLETTERLIADMLGVAVPSVAAAAARLQTEGTIRCRPGAITVLDRAALEKRACECYALAKREFGRLLHLPGSAEASPLASFIGERMDDIVAEWEAFARTLLPAAATMTGVALRDHAKPILQAIAKHTESPRTGVPPSGEGTAATSHGALRHTSGFDLLQLASEYRALRASVIKLWRSQLPKEHHAALDELARFDESVDQALGESIASYADEVGRSRDTFLAILGHDLRGPLSAVSMSGLYLSRAGLESRHQLQAVDHIQRGAARMETMIRDLLEYTGARLGRGLPVTPRPCSIGTICAAGVEEMKAGHPDREFRLEIRGDPGGSFDVARLQQAIGNLLNNALQHGAADAPVVVEVHGGSDEVRVRVINQGVPIPVEALQIIFDPLVQLPAASPSPQAQRSTSLGLGLYIARSIVRGHGGTLAVESTAERGTVFTARFPRAGSRKRDTLPVLYDTAQSASEQARTTVSRQP
jgi:signal transduction histidine kinase/CRP-like cAMP-binding protein